MKDAQSNEDTKPFKELGWSQENIAYVVGCSRPALKKWFETAEGLTIEQEAKLIELFKLQMTYKAFEREAIGRLAFEKVWKPSYIALSKKEQPNV